jgi:hypothetical protein
VASAPVYYPGTTDQSAASLVKVAAGEERTGLDFALDFVPAAKVEGVVTDPNGQPPGSLQLNMLQPAQSFLDGPPVFMRPDKDGKFSTTGILPGQYVLVARGTAASSTVAPPPRQPVTGPTVIRDVPLPLWAMLDLTIDGHDVTDLNVKLQPGMNVSGRVVFEGETTPPAAEDLTRIRVGLSASGLGTGVTVGVPSVQPNADGTFTIKGVTPSKYRLTASMPGGSLATAWSLKSTIVGGRDSQDYPIEIVAGQDVAGVVITFTDRPTDLTGTLLDAAGHPAPEYSIVVFSTDKTMWLQNSRRVKLVRPGNTGNYKLTGLPAGEYYLCALTDVQQNQLADASFLESLISSSIKVTLSEGEKKTQDLKLAGGGL